MTTERYLTETDRRTFEATVERVLDDRVVLDSTCFYPTGGGQPHDTGVLRADGETWRVTRVEKRDTVYHTLDTVDADPPAVGTTVVGELDWDRRYAHMRYHTAQHLLSAVLLERFDAETTGNQLYDDHAHLDCSYPRFSATDLADIEDRLNDIVTAEYPVEWYVLDREEADTRLDPERTRLHLLPDSITEIRIVEVSEPDGTVYDRTACAGTHVASTGELGTVEIVGRETKGANEERVEFVLS
ncbi:alanyl-tRNA editing protein [Salinigranum rubrum]|uniref:Alanyl-tRNA editing protein n=1 Tax=Salinigranum rubrum TaxID=755307 RepID=A0A2I8VGM4_9EURY|nr:alanyl-tRNA editing protein [Salinigranum rubrum]AUV81072.1 alanyl-tRNA editing protein [Salinigranum rubrum]